MKLPKQISPCPIIDALVDIRFSTTINENAVFGIIYRVLQEDYPKVDPLPILQIPEFVRSKDPNLKHKPHYKISNRDYVIQIGPDVLVIGSFPKYVGWNAFSKTIYALLEKINSLNIIHCVERFSIRYINFFEYDIFDKTKVSININSDEIQYKNTILKTEIVDGNFCNVVQIANGVNINISHQNKDGSLIDIESSTTTNLTNFLSEPASLMEQGHTNEKQLFFNLLKEDLLTQLNPIY